MRGVLVQPDPFLRFGDIDLSPDEHTKLVPGFRGNTLLRDSDHRFILSFPLLL
jgi:hypothetical protein